MKRKKTFSDVEDDSTMLKPVKRTKKVTSLSAEVPLPLGLMSQGIVLPFSIDPGGHLGVAERVCGPQGPTISIFPCKLYLDSVNTRES